MSTYNTKDIFIQRRTSTGTFEEHPLVVQPNSIITTDPDNNLVMINSSSFLAGTASSALFLTTDSAPGGTPTKGTSVYNTSSNMLYVFNGTAWKSSSFA